MFIQGNVTVNSISAKRTDADGISIWRQSCLPLAVTFRISLCSLIAIIFHRIYAQVSRCCHSSFSVTEMKFAEHYRAWWFHNLTFIFRTVFKSTLHRFNFDMLLWQEHFEKHKAAVRKQLCQTWENSWGLNFRFQLSVLSFIDVHCATPCLSKNAEPPVCVSVLTKETAFISISGVIYIGCAIQRKNSTLPEASWFIVFH